MRSYSEREVFRERELRLLAQAQDIVERIDDRADPDPNGVRCHEVARVVGYYLSLNVIDGQYGSVDHSWLSMREPGSRRRSILDPYCVGRMPMVQIIDFHPLLVHEDNYKPGKTRRDVRINVVQGIIMKLGGTPDDFMDDEIPFG